MKCVIIDDEPIALDILREYIAKVPSLECAGAFRNPLEAVAFLQCHEVDLLFLDVNMPGLTGLQVLKSLTRRPCVIFTTAYSEYAVASYEFDAVDYLLKPIEFERFFKAVNKARERVTTEENPPAEAQETLLIKSGKKLHRVRLRDLRYLRASDNYVSFCAAGKEILSLMTMKDALELLPAADFVRVHKSYIVNLEHIQVIESDSVLVGDRRIPIGSLYREEFLQSLERLKRRRS